MGQDAGQRVGGHLRRERWARRKRGPGCAGARAREVKGTEAAPGEQVWVGFSAEHPAQGWICFHMMAVLQSQRSDPLPHPRREIPRGAGCQETLSNRWPEQSGDLLAGTPFRGGLFPNPQSPPGERLHFCVVQNWIAVPSPRRARGAPATRSKS